MGEKLGELSTLRTDRISRAVPKSQRREHGSQQFKSHMKGDGDAKEEKRPDADQPGDPACCPKRTVRRGNLIDFEA